MPKMIATKPITYDRRTIEAGEEFEVAESYVGTLQSLGRATLKEGKGTKVKPTGTRSTDDDTGNGDNGDDKSSTYKTRRLKAGEK
jgi:hypothetical protein